MSARPRIATAPAAKGKPVTLSSLAEKKALGEPIVVHVDDGNQIVTTDRTVAELLS